MSWQERAVTFPCEGSHLVGILNIPYQPKPYGIVIIVGGPQYRSGSHRQFTLLARRFAAQGIPVLRFDCRGMGDSEGNPRQFDEFNEDIKAAVDCLFSIVLVHKVILWGLCDGATAAALYAPRDARISGLVLVNPWVRTEKGLAKTHLKHYYLKRMSDPRFLASVLTGRAALGRGIAELCRSLFASMGRGGNASDSDLPDRFLTRLLGFSGDILTILSTEDLTAQEFKNAMQGRGGWKTLLRLERIKVMDLEGANHTFSEKKHREFIAVATERFVAALCSSENRLQCTESCELNMR